MYNEKEASKRVLDFLISKNYKILEQIKIRGRVVDIVAIKNNDISLIEVKGSSGDVLRGIGQAMHYSGCGNYSYLALPKENVTKELKHTIKNLGIGIMAITDNGAEEVITAKRTESLESVKSIVFNFKPIAKKKRVISSLLENIIGSKSRIRILELFLFYSEKNFYLREIARLTGENTNSVRRELNNLTDADIITRQKKGNLIFYEINKKSPMYEPLKTIFMRTESLGKHLNESLKNKNVKYALIYGSFASGRETKKSDMDLLIIGTIKQADIIDVISNFERKMLREINYIVWTEKEFKKRIKEKHHLLMDIIKNPMIMIIGDEDEFRRVAK